jgi:hypothetical protein
MYVSPYLAYNENTLNYYKDDVRLAEYTLRSEKAGVDLAFRIGEQSVLGEARVGVNFNSYSVRPKLGGIIINNQDGSQSNGSLPSADFNRWHQNQRHH